ncbi:MAG: UvrD-helicase domain-containing protein [Neisseriales bacterium]|nr:MAG: UvrD-helicase domain-containing protein [Neisseriales bacterium]
MLSADSLLVGLNPQQVEAVTVSRGSTLILAGAGSGKTRVLTTRIAYLLASQQAQPHQILAVTFTNKAAKEIDARIRTMVSGSINTMWAGTFHGLCHRLLRIHHLDAQLPKSFQILDSADQLSIIKRLFKSQQLPATLLQPKLVQYFINHHKESGKRAHQLTGSSYQDQQLTQLFGQYDDYCRQAGLVDFAELLLRSYELLTTHPVLAQHYQQRFLHVLVDEFQDTNILQYQWLKQFIGEHAALFAVGDDDQSIYGFRGAEVGNMRALLSDFGVSEPIRLEQNYRSMGNILAAANAVIKQNVGRLDKALWTASGEGEAIKLYEAITDQTEARYIVQTVKQLQKTNIPLHDIAVLYRSNAQSRVFEQILFDQKIPYRIYGGMRFFERQEIKHAMAYLRLIVNANDNDALLRIINIPARGIGSRTVEALIQDAHTEQISLWQAIKNRAQQSPDKLKPFMVLIETLQSLIDRTLLAPLIGQAIELSGLKKMYEASPKEHGDRLENLEELVNAAVNFTADEDMPPLVAFLNNAALESGEYQAEHGQSALQLMTIHAAKGLEFDTVFIAGLEEGLFPHENSLTNVQETEEERRLMYVAITRAKRQLYVTYARQRTLHGRLTYPICSRFIKDIPEHLMRRVSADYVAERYTKSTAHHALSADTVPCDMPYRIGQNVIHNKFGSGVIVGAEKMGTALCIQVNFLHSGTKWLDMTYAKLQIVKN